MKADGLGDERRQQIDQIAHLVKTVSAFSRQDFDKMTKAFEGSDGVMFDIMNKSAELADGKYTQFLNAKIAGVPFQFAHLDRGFCQISDGESVLGKVMSELRGKISDEKEYRTEFLGPAISNTAKDFDQSLKRVQEAEIKHWRDEVRSRGRTFSKQSFEIEL